MAVSARTDRAEELARHLICDAEYFEDQVQQGRRRLEEFSHENTRRRFDQLINANKNREHEVN